MADFPEVYQQMRDSAQKGGAIHNTARKHFIFLGSPRVEINIKKKRNTKTASNRKLKKHEFILGREYKTLN